MRKNILRFLVVIAAAVSLAPISGAAEPANDEAGIRALEVQQQEAWNRHDAKAYSNLFTEEGDCVNVVGWWWKGRAAIETKLIDAYAFVFRESILTVKDVNIKFLAPEIAVAHVRWTMVGARTPKGMPEPQQGIQTQVLQKQAGKWLIASFQNTNAVPEMPFPKGPPLAPPTPGVTP